MNSFAILRFISIAFLVLLTSVAGISEQGLLNQNDHNEQKWEHKNGGSEDYEMIVQRICFCPPAACGCGKMKVEVVAGAIVEAKYLIKDVTTGVEEEIDVPVYDWDMLPTVQVLFEKIHDAIERDPAVSELNVSYHNSLGYPTSLYIDYDNMIADEEYSASVLELERTM